MDINFDDIKKEFDALKAVKDIKEEACEIGCETAEDEESGFIETIQKYMLAPVRCGIYFSRLDIKVIGLMIDEDVQVRERKRMLRDILRSITSKEGFAAFIDAVDATAKQKIAVYDELAQNFPHSAKIFEGKKEAYEKFRKVLDKILQDFEEVEQA
ncbi:hypothetical protein NitYY0826_C0691 [Nitratiruptor sp. YY08-26]|uniref:hypothetical protein n=1 Tax=unclassified Nitratiruptor TaxID=2624044 RepID=UPI001914FA9D|nr:MULTISPECIES: hypothetical protein [unclassified Nitratiruptor]BCD61828.1 hypothetical protein NitYY0813_C0689 [Nitratiruptor sp. YY08-13]BCD65763.1 hypothetical protein NitYY0826_C0691 [Nitratiruptor sp. YY08-26]